MLRRSDVGQTLVRGYQRIPGAVAFGDELPLAPTREFARPILGTVGPVTAEMVKQSKGAYAPGDEAGLSGLEQRYDEQLRGTPGVAVDAVPPEGDPRELFSTEPTPGTPLRLTLDPGLQELAERCSPGSVRRARWSPYARATGTCWPPPAGRGRTATRPRRSAGTPPAPPSRW